MFFCVLHKVLYRENSKMRFLWKCDNGKIDCTLQSQYAEFEPCLVTFVVVLDAPLLKSLTSASVNYLLETPCLFTWCIMKTK